MADLGCLWSVHARVENSSKAFVIKQFDDVHTCGSSFRTIKHTRMTSSMIGGLISSEVRNKALTSISEAVCDFQDYYGTEVSYRRAWMSVEKPRDVIFVDYSSSFDDLRWYIDTANDCNPGSVFDMEFDIDSKGRHFKCLFFSFEACIHGFKYCRPVLMLDETFLKGRHKCCLLAATEKDSNQGLYPLCFAIVDSERYDNWHSLLSKLFAILTPGRDITFVTDQHAGLLKALAKVISFSSHSFCPTHLKTNLKTYLSVKSRESKEYLLTPFSRCANAPTIELFNELFEEFKGRCGRNVQKFLEDYYHVRSYCDSYLHSIYPVPSMWKPNIVLDDDVVLPHLCKKLVRCPRTERIPSKGGSRELGAVGVERWELIIERHVKKLALVVLILIELLL
ncbi:uncharacterized protein LOC114279047 [Camellia sinensis]|uniref:uncharacterized protein LOC114279047 n=1 Tax=Camellia sinensis TaxID=4442 RepID=UPI001035C7B8|nr:uncharacterized protein LOC114279047 [Camellia sinensis]